MPYNVSFKQDVVKETPDYNAKPTKFLKDNEAQFTFPFHGC